MLPLVGSGLLPADIDGKQKPKNEASIPIIGRQDDGGYDATDDALNIWELDVKWRSAQITSIILKTQLPVTAFNSAFACASTAHDCLP